MQFVKNLVGQLQQYGISHFPKMVTEVNRLKQVCLLKNKILLIQK